MLLDLLRGRLWQIGTYAGAVCTLACAAMLAKQLVVVAQMGELVQQQQTKYVEAQRDRANEREAMAREVVLQQERVREAERLTAAKLKENDDAADRKRVEADRAAAGQLATAVRLRDRYASLAASCTVPSPAGAASAVGAGAAAPAAGDLLIDMLDRTSDAARELARYADQLRITSEQCAADYETVRRNVNGLATR